jgi:capsid protein
VNYSSARMARLELKANVHEWREHMLLPQLCGGVWRWAMELAAAFEGWPTIPTAEWACPPMSILEPDKEALAYQRMIRAGLMTWGQAVRELGYDPRDQLKEIEEYNKLLDKAGIVLDTDPRRTNAAGQQQQLPASAGADAGDGGDATDASDAADQTTH